MKSPALSDKEPAPEKAGGAGAKRSEHALSSGRVVTIQSGEGEDQIEIRSGDGTLEVQVSLTEKGPVLSLRGARLEIESTDSVAVNCRRFDVNASERVRLRAEGEIGLRSQTDIRLKSDGQTFIDGDYVNLNCLERKGYHDDPERAGESPPASPGDGADAAAASPPPSP